MVIQTHMELYHGLVQNLRYSENQRWTKLLEKKLGSDFRAIENGLPARTIDLDYEKDQSVNGLTTFESALSDNLPLDWIIIFLGTNDTKTKFDRSPDKMIEGTEKYLDLIDMYSLNSKILLVAPVPVNENIANNSYTPNLWIGTSQKTRQFSILLENLTLKRKTEFLDLSKIAQVSQVDGIHFDLDTQEAIARVLSKIIIKI